MTSGVIADSIVNLCGAIGVAVAMMTFYRRDPRSPLTRRLLLALGVIATLFLDRGLAWWSGSFVLDRLSVIPAALIPLGALIVTEGILRRHAPRPAVCSSRAASATGQQRQRQRCRQNARDGAPTVRHLISDAESCRLARHSKPARFTPKQGPTTAQRPSRGPWRFRPKAF